MVQKIHVKLGDKTTWETMESLLNFTSDFGFKRFMENREFVISFLNAALPVNIQEVRSAPTSRSGSTEDIGDFPPRPASISDFSFLDKELRGKTEADKAIVYDFICQTSDGRFVNVEVQRAKQRFYLHRAIYYTSRMIARDGFKGKKGGKPWNWELHPAYHIALLDFSFEDIVNLQGFNSDQWKLWSRLAFDNTLCVPSFEDFRYQSDIFNICLISLPAFKNYIEKQSVTSSMEKFVWMFAFSGQNCALPSWTIESPFNLILKTMKVKTLNIDEQEIYEREIREQMDEHDRILTAKVEGIAEGIAKGRSEGIAEGIAKGRSDGVAIFAREIYKQFSSKTSPKEAYDQVVAYCANVDSQFDVIQALGPRPE